ncbi:MAG: hypothetical protein K0R00_207 [Herbinix sp.]|jgi:hypothetical protein|nr:hypothetical protein [Herbinix sp.]
MKSQVVNGTMFHVKIIYKDGGHKYANIFSEKDYYLGISLGTIVGYKEMNCIERFIFRNCL